MASDAWPEAFEMPGKAIWRLQNATNHWGGRGSAPDPDGGAYSAPSDSLAGGEGLAAPSPRTLPRSRPFRPRSSSLWASPLPAPNFQTPSEVKSYIRPWTHVCLTDSVNMASLGKDESCTAALLVFFVDWCFFAAFSVIFPLCILCILIFSITLCL